MIEMTRWFVVGFIAVSALLLIGRAGGRTPYTPPGPIWHIERKTYRCAGDPTYVICHSSPKLNDEAPYRVLIDGRHFWVSFGGKLIYECWVRSSPNRCRTIP